MAKAFRMIGTTDESTECDLCGKVELKVTVMLLPLDADGNADGEITYFGRSCATKATGWTMRELNANIRRATVEKQTAERARRIAEREAETKAYNAWVAETYGTGAPLKDAIQKHGVAGLWAQFREARAN
jgi:hypothetical protein